MKKIVVFLLFASFAGFLIAGTTNPESNYQWKAGYNITLDQGDITLSDGDIDVNGEVTASSITVSGERVLGVSAAVSISTYTELTLTDPIMVIKGTGVITNAATPFISTTTYSQGTVVYIVGSSTNTVTLSDTGSVSGTLLNLGATTRTLGDGDVLELILIGDKWREVNPTNQ